MKTLLTAHTGLSFKGLFLPSTQDPNAAFTCYRETVQEVFCLQLHKPIVRTESAALIGSLPQHLIHPLL